MNDDHMRIFACVQLDFPPRTAVSCVRVRTSSKLRKCVIIVKRLSDSINLARQRNRGQAMHGTEVDLTFARAAVRNLAWLRSLDYERRNRRFLCGIGFGGMNGK